MKASKMTQAELYDYVIKHSRTGDPDCTLWDWIAEGDLSDETADDVVEQWDSDRE